MIDVVVIGGGISGLATAARLQAAGLTTTVLEAHGQPGGCAGFFHRKGFAFDVGATTLVDFSPGGIGGDLLREIGLTELPAEELPGYVAWLPDRQVTLYRDVARWRQERVAKLGNTSRHHALWRILDRLANVFWQATRRGVKLPVRTVSDLGRIVRSIAISDWLLFRYMNWTVGDLLRSLGLGDERALIGLLSMLVEDTVHAQLDAAPLINGSLGITIRGAGLMRPNGGMFGFWQRFVQRYKELGGNLRVGRPVRWVEQVASGSGQCGYVIHTRRGVVAARHVVCAVPVEVTARLAPELMAPRLAPYLHRNREAVGGALVLFLGVPDHEVAEQEFTHHQLLQDYGKPLGNGNNMFVSVSAAGDHLSAPTGHRAVMVSTHCNLNDWQDLSETAYQAKKQSVVQSLLRYARQVYPRLGAQARVSELGTPRTYERFTHRPRGAVGGYRLSLQNSNQRAIPHHLGVPGFWLVGDTTWPGLGTVACVHGSRIVAEEILRELRPARHRARHHERKNEDVDQHPELEPVLGHRLPARATASHAGGTRQ